MAIGTSVHDLGILIIGGLLCLLIPAVLMLIGKLIEAILGKKAGGFALVFMLFAVAGLLLAASLYLDTAGQTAQGLVTTKHEGVKIRREGDWRHYFQAQVSYRLDGGKVETEYTTDPQQASVGLNLGAAHYDGLVENQEAELRIVRIWNSISLVRLVNISTIDLIPFAWIFAGLGIFGLGWLILKVVKSVPGCLIMLLVIGVGVIGITGAVIYQQWQSMENLAAKPLRAQATIKKVTRITQIDPLPCENDCSGSWDTDFDVPQQYDIVQVSFVPQGSQDTVIGVDAADDGTFRGSEGRSIEVAYAPNAPRDIQLIGATHSHHWKNMLAFLALELGTLLALLLIAFVVSRFEKRRKATG